MPEMSSLTAFYDVLLHGRFLVENESKVPCRIRKWDVVRAKSNRIGEGNGGRFQGRRKGKEKDICIFSHIEIGLRLGGIFFRSKHTPKETAKHR